MANAISELQVLLAEISDLHHASSLLHWDQNTMMPPLGAPLRAEHLATLSRITHERFISARTGELIEAAAEELDGLPPDSVQQRIVSEARRLYEKDRRVPLELAADRAKASSDGYRVWIRARAENDFAAYAPVLERNFQLARDYVACFDEYEDPYDVVLDDFVPRHAHGGGQHPVPGAA